MLGSVNSFSIKEKMLGDMAIIPVNLPSEVDVEAVGYFKAFMAQFNVNEISTKTIAHVNSYSMQLSELAKALDILSDGLVYPEKEVAAIEAIRSVFEKSLQILNPIEPEVR